MSLVSIVGSYGVGMTFYASRFPEAGETLVGTQYRHEHGGKGSNQAVAAARMGADVTFLTAIGDDEFGRKGQEMWEAEGIESHAVVINGETTMVGAIIVDENAENRIVIVNGALDHLDPTHVAGFADVIRASDVVVVQQEIPEDVVAATLQIARDNGVTTILNPAPARPVAADVLALVDHLIPNEGEARGLGGTGEELQKITGGTVVVTLGENGARVIDKSGTTDVAAVKVVAIDTVGAGDTFTGAYAVGIADGLSAVEAAKLAVKAAAISVTRQGVIPAIPTKEEVEKL